MGECGREKSYLARIGGSSGSLEPSADGGQAFDGLTEDIAPFFGKNNEVLDPHAAATWHVDARLDGHDVPGLERVARGGAREPRPLVHLEPHPVPEPVAEVVAVALRGDQIARDGVDL